MGSRSSPYILDEHSVVKISYHLHSDVHVVNLLSVAVKETLHRHASADRRHSFIEYIQLPCLYFPYFRDKLYFSDIEFDPYSYMMKNDIEKVWRLKKIDLYFTY